MQAVGRRMRNNRIRSGCTRVTILIVDVGVISEILEATAMGDRTLLYDICYCTPLIGLHIHFSSRIGSKRGDDVSRGVQGPQKHISLCSLQGQHAMSHFRENLNVSNTDIGTDSIL